MPSLCALCGLNRDLRNSHILPEFFYKLIYDPNPQRFHVLSTEPSTPERFLQKGLRERLLCGDCEQKLSRWEHYAKRVLIDAHGVQVTPVSHGWVFSGIDYKRFKLFQLSLLWRMGVSNLPFFEDVELGPHEARLRTALLNADPLQPDNYACLVIAVRIGQKLYPDWILEPSEARVEGQRCYWLVISGMLYMFFVGSHTAPRIATPFVLNTQNQMGVLDMDIHDIPFLSQAALKLRDAINTRKTAG